MTALSSIAHDLTPEELAVAQQVAQEYMAGRTSPLLAKIWDADYERKPVSPTQFCRDKYYLGGMIEELHDNWVKELEIVFGEGSDINEWLIIAAIGSGKTTVATVGTLYCIYKLTCLRDPAARYGLMSGSKIVFGVFNITLSRSDTAYENMKLWVDGSPYFQQNCPRTKRPGEVIYFPSKRIQVVQGSLGEHVLSENLFGIMMDEGNFYKRVKGQAAVTEGDKTRAHNIYESCKRREVSRFMQYGSVPGINMLISSRQTASSFLEQRAAKNLPGVHISAMPLWKAKPAEQFCGRTFPVMVGNSLRSSQILEPDELPPEGHTVVEVPVEYRGIFEEDIDNGLRDFANIAVGTKGKFFAYQEKIHACCDHQRQHPFTMESLRGVSTENASNNIIDYLLVDMLFRTTNSRSQLRVNPGVPRVAHVDIGLSGDPLGIAIGHLTPGLMTLYYDILLEICPPVRGEIEIEAVVDFFRELRRLGMPFKSISYDQFQSKQSVQQLNKAGFKASKVSAGYAEYEVMRRRVYGGPSSCSYYPYPPLIRQLLDQEKGAAVGDKPDHPANQHDDVLESAVIVAAQLAADTTARPGRKTNYMDHARRMLPRMG